MVLNPINHYNPIIAPLIKILNPSYFCLAPGIKIVNTFNLPPRCNQEIETRESFVLNLVYKKSIMLVAHNLHTQEEKDIDPTI
jgi:hypothetical protein